ncbi:MAG: cytochrome c oxidase subunit II [Trueperaceae bacterium]|nr:cytochrome c oxidase subunit II [Trueperaceae bacterium]
MSWTKSLRIGAVVLLSLLGGCAFTDPQSTLDVAGPIARSQLRLFNLTLWLGAGVFLIVAVALIYAVWRYRARSDDTELPPQIHGHALLETAWTIAPALLIVIIALATVPVIWENERISRPGDGDILEVNVTGYQWWWEFEYPSLGITTANELHIPVGQRVRLNLTSDDVIHSFWVPKLAGKKDLIPNQNNVMWMMADADKPGVYFGQCAEFCLTAHAHMRFRVVADTEDDFGAWVSAFQNAANQQVVAEPQIQQGAELFMRKGCAGCHAVRGVAQGQAGPDLTNFGQRLTVGAGILDNTPEDLARWLRDPQQVKPGNYMPVLWDENDTNAEAEIAALVAYLQSLGTAPAQSAQAHP